MQGTNPVQFVSRKTQVLFHRLKNGLMKLGLSDADVFEHLAFIAIDKPDAMRALALHIRDILIEMGEEDLSYGDVLAEAYRRCLFDPQHFDRYGMFEPTRDLDKLTVFVESVVSFSDEQEFVGSYPMPSLLRH